MPETSEAHEEEGSPLKKWDRRRIMRWIVMPLAAVLAVAALVMGVLNLTILRPARVVSASAETSTNYVVLDAGVANLVSSEVSVTATIKESAEQRSQARSGDDNSAQRMMCVVAGSTTDVDAWMAAQAVAYTRVTGLRNWTSLSTQNVAKTGTAAKDQVQLSDSDLWALSNCAERTATLRITGAQPYEKIIAYSPSGVSSVRVNWNRTNMPNTAIPWFSWAAVFIVVAVLAMTWLSGEDPFGAQRRKRKREEQLAALEARGIDTGMIPSLDEPYVPYQKKSKTGITHRTRTNGLFGGLFGKKETTPEDSTQKDTPKPTVVDPSSVNLVASTGAGATDSAWSPSVINRTDSQAQGEQMGTLTGQELLEYLARLAVEGRSDTAQDAAEDTAEEMSEESGKIDTSEKDDAHE
ncbi:hypothetical protein B9G54_04060 [Alloscardovia macacae]|nr:heme exporter protein CcmD [Alloscardovia macacae]OTA26569.1 hypothetical protein B9G54_04060 [Alloscardovia macacae]